MARRKRGRQLQASAVPKEDGEVKKQRQGWALAGIHRQRGDKAKTLSCKPPPSKNAQPAN